VRNSRHNEAEYEDERKRVRDKTDFWKEAEGRPNGAVKMWKIDSDAQMIRQSMQESEQMIKTEGQTILSGEERMILLFNSTILQGDCHFVEKFFNL
jgi:hypothetical protein